MSADTPLPGDRPRTPMPHPDTDPTSDILPSELLGDLAGYDSNGTDLMPLPEGALDDLPPPSGGSSWLGREKLAADESDVIRGLTATPPPPGSSNIFDTGPAGSSRFRLSQHGTEHLTGEQPRPSNDVLYADLGSPAAPSSVVFSGDDLFDRPGLSEALRPSDSDSGGLPGSGSGPNFNTTVAGDEGSNLFADPTAADLELDDEGVPLGDDPHSSEHLERSGPGSSIFAGDVGPHGSGLDVDRIPIMASNDEGRADRLDFDAPPPSGLGSGVGADIFGSHGKPPRPSGLGAVAFDLPGGADDPDATERSDGGVSWDLPDPEPAPGHLPLSQKSRRMTADEAVDLPGGGVPTVRRSAAHVTGRAPLPDAVAPRATGYGWLAGGGVGALVGAGAAAAGLYLGGFLGADTARPSQPQAVVQTTPDPTLAGQLEAARKSAEEAEAKAQAAENRVAAARQEGQKLRAELEKAKLPDPQLQAAQRQVLDLTAVADAAKKEKDAAAQKLTAATAGRAEAEAGRKAAEADVAGVVKSVKDAKLVPEADEPAAVLAKLPTVLQSAAAALNSADGKKAAELLAAADKRTEAAKAELAAARKATATAEAALTAARDELAATKAKADERVTAAVAAAEAKAAKELEAARGREAALTQQIAQVRQEGEQARAKLEAEFARQLADARSGVVVPLSTGELRDRDLATADLGRGMAAFFHNQQIDAWRALESATARNPNDARGWYFLGLVRWRAGDTTGADAAFRKAADLERKGLTARREVNDALLKVQGVERTVLAGYRP